MRKQRLMYGVGVALVAGVVALAGCAPQTLSDTGDDASSAAEVSEGVPETGLRPLADWQSGNLDPTEYREAIFGAYLDRAEEYPTEVITFDDGVSVRRTPFPARDTTAHLKNNISYNTYRLDAENRGCWSCHEDLGELVQNMGDAPHTAIDSSLGIEVTVSQCIDCHNSHLGGRYEGQFAGLMHTIHGKRNKMFSEEKNGDCWSCHYGVPEESGIGKTAADPEGLHLWDEVKHNVLRGITTKAAEDFTGTFSVDQNYVEGPDAPLWNMRWIKNSEDDVSNTRYGQDVQGKEPDPSTDGVYDSWSITINSEGGQTVTKTLRQLIDEVGSEDVIMTAQCLNNGENGAYITNREVKGIPLMKIAELVGAGDATFFEGEGDDGNTTEFGLDLVRNNGGYLVYEVSGKPLPYGAGYPCQIWLGGWVADENLRGVTDMTFKNGEWEPSLWREGDFSKKEGVAGYAPNVGIAHLREGQIINLGEEFTFEGYAATYIHQISDIEISMDHGKTWQTFQTPDQDPSRWSWWSFKYTPEEVGSYCIMVRAHDTGGYETPEPAEIMFNVEDPSEAK